MNPYVLIAAKFALALVLLDVPVALAGCAAPEPSDSRADNQIAAEGSDIIFIGVWEGTSVSECYGMALCPGLKEIRLTMMPNGRGMAGYYRCEPSTAACQDVKYRGRITKVALNHRLPLLGAVLPDDQDCVLRSAAQADEMEGRFHCEQRSIMIDHGLWADHRSY